MIKATLADRVIFIMAKLIINNGQRFNKLIVVKELPTKRLPSGQTNRVFLCICDCGNKTEVRLVHLCRDRTRSCGCLVGESHDECDKGVYNSWRGMRDRCSRDSHNRFKYYKGKGITICDEWNKSFHAFRKWAYNNGWQEGLSIDRVDNNKGYYPSNCRFTTSIIQVNNTSVNLNFEYKGVVKLFRILLRELGLYEHSITIYRRLRRGYSIERAVETPIRVGNYSRRL